MDVIRTEPSKASARSIPKKPRSCPNVLSYSHLRTLSLALERERQDVEGLGRAETKPSLGNKAPWPAPGSLVPFSKKSRRFRQHRARVSHKQLVNQRSDSASVTRRA
ncbi:uncharacterized protein LOC122538101 [Frieseomelitta varia]|uniref:uncharacterized protein LOC122538101 n=1 Tax=Frieseomelitta varia TaxID=561572 RepID=UPI001CB68370|nr:uncharacterized protein LOC122538101 [Frieseomelitta varia]